MTPFSSQRKKERTFVMIKPDAVQRSLIGVIIKRFERVGLKLVALKMIIPTKDLIASHYTVDSEWIRKVGEKTINGYKAQNSEPPSKDPIEVGNKVLGRLVKYLSSSPAVLMVWQGMHAVEIVRKINGGTEPLLSDVGTIRGDFVIDSYKVAGFDDRAVRNAIHASGTIDEAKREINLWFKLEEILNYKLVQEQILYDVNLDGILE